MTKAKAKKIMLEETRSIIDPKWASKIAQAYGFKLKDLLTPKPTKEYYRAWSTNQADWEAKGIAVYLLALTIAEKLNPKWKPETPRYYGMGRIVESYTEQALKVI